MKQWLGIEGVKLELVLPEKFSVEQGTLEGKIRMYSKNAQTVSGLRLVLIEKYTRGREEEQLVDEYMLGELIIRDEIPVPAEGEIVEVPFSLPFEPMQSEVDVFGSKNFLYKGLAWVARKTRNAESEYRVEAEAQVTGVGLSPFVQQVIGS
ncbi:hypothetical protein FUA23_17210 [Neolewinella aurantiaca]|uniref:Arrestin-like N-terminal domain-containing protein n=2 Tax=Neolewinella aurantiaca TaxID=2602767 RepID=A0A5C7FKK2_9BACT|nr:hypothetical protein FUA23_17210 [Neolewinella aurantiaca]